MDVQRRVDPRIRAHGRARIDITRNAKDEADWRRRWKAPKYGFPFEWGDGWVHSVEYKVDDFAAEVGFFIDVLALPVAAFSPSYAFFSGPNGEFAFGVVAVEEGEISTLPQTLRLQFNVKNVLETMEELEARGVDFEQKPYPAGLSDETLHTAYFRTPHGICVDLLGHISVGDDNDEGSTSEDRGDNIAYDRYSQGTSDQENNVPRNNGGLPFKDHSKPVEISRENEELPEEEADDEAEEETYKGYSVMPGLESYTSEDVDERDETQGFQRTEGSVENRTHRSYPVRSSSQRPSKWNRSSGNQKRSRPEDRSREIKYVQLEDPYPED